MAATDFPEATFRAAAGWLADQERDPLNPSRSLGPDERKLRFEVAFRQLQEIARNGETAASTVGPQMGLAICAGKHPNGRLVYAKVLVWPQIVHGYRDGETRPAFVWPDRAGRGE